MNPKKIAILLIFATLLPIISSATYLPKVQASTGEIGIDPATTLVQTGGNINLYFGSVSWASSQFYLIISPNNVPDLSGTRYTVIIDVTSVRASSVSTLNVMESAYDGYWQLGYDWINGSIPYVAPGRYYIKAFDGSTTSLAVTNPYFTVFNSTMDTIFTSFAVSPTIQSPGQAIRLTGRLQPNPPAGGYNVALHFANSSGSEFYTYPYSTDTTGVFSQYSNAPSAWFNRPGDYSVWVSHPPEVIGSINYLYSESTKVTVTVVPALTVSASPTNTTVTINQTATFTATATGGITPYTYQWFEGTTSVGSSSTLTISRSVAGNYSFYCRVRDSANVTVPSNNVTLGVNPPLQVSVSPPSLPVTIGQFATFTATASGGISPYTYQWFEGVTQVGTSAALTVSRSVGTYLFYCRVRDSANVTINSNNVTLVVNSLLQVAVSPPTLTLDAGQSATLSATATGGISPHTYQWFDGATPTGMSPTLTISKTASGTYLYYCRVRDSANTTVSSSNVTVFVNPPPQVAVAPQTASVKTGQSATFTASVSGGTPPYSYQWFANSTSEGSTSSLSVSKSSAGTYSFYCIVRDAVNASVTSNTATLTVTVADDASPQTQISLSGTSGENRWYLSDVSVTLSATDNVAVLRTEYSLNSVDWQTYTTPFSLTSEGRTTMYYRSTDTSLNTESTKTTEIKIDKTPPTGTLTINNGAKSTNTTEVLLALLTGDNVSGITELRFSNDGVTYGPWQQYSASASWTLQNEVGQRTVYVQLKDEAGRTSTSTASIELTSEGGLPTEFIVIGGVAAAAATIGAAAYAKIIRRRPQGPARGEEAKKEAKPTPPLLHQLRWIQAQVYEVATGKQRIRRTDAFRANSPHNLDVRVGPADLEWLTPSEEAVIPEDKMTYKNNISQLQVVFSEPNHSPAPQTSEIALPREGPSNICTFTFNPRDEVPNFRGRVIVLHRNRILQTALLEGKVVSNPEEFSNLKLNFDVESIIEPDLSDLSSRKAFDVAFIANRNIDNKPGITTIAGKEARFNTPEGVETTIGEITKLLEEVITDPDYYGTDMENEKNLTWIRNLAFNGRDLYDGIVVAQIGPKRLLGINRVQLISTIEKYVPLEFIYDMPIPKTNAKLCHNWRKSLESGPCGNCKIKGTVSPTVICPMGFWGLRLIIERHHLDPYNKPDLGSYTNALRGKLSLKGRPVLKVLESAVLAVSDQVDKAKQQSREVLKVLKEATHEKVTEVTSLKSWRRAIKETHPSLIVLLTHISQTSQDPEEFQMEIGKGVGLDRRELTEEYVAPSEEATRPVVLLLGCSTMSAAVPFRSFAAGFHYRGAAAVLSTITEVLGRHVAPISAQFVSNLEKIAEEGLSLGDALLSVRRKTLAAGIPMVLTLVATGDADLMFESAEAC